MFIEELDSLLQSKDTPQDVVDYLNEHGVDGKTLMLMTSEHLKENCG